MRALTLYNPPCVLKIPTRQQDHPDWISPLWHLVCPKRISKFPTHPQLHSVEETTTETSTSPGIPFLTPTGDQGFSSGTDCRSSFACSRVVDVRWRKPVVGFTHTLVWEGASRVFLGSGDCGVKDDLPPGWFGTDLQTGRRTSILYSNTIRWFIHPWTMCRCLLMYQS